MRNGSSARLAAFLCAGIILLLAGCGGSDDTTKPKAADPPTVITFVVTEVTEATALCGGDVTDDGGADVTARGVCWSAGASPTTSNETTEDGTGTGSFTSTLTGLSAGTKYYIRAYATNSAGTGYGAVDSFSTTGTVGTVTDIDGNVYATVKIGNQWWMAENLRVTHYRNGDEIPVVTVNDTWWTLAYGACCSYDNSVDNLAVYGRLYNWRAVSDARGLAPEGWHVAADWEWSTLVDYLGGMGVAGGEMKETGTGHWLTPNEGATNSAGFNALPGGGRGYMGYFVGLQANAWFWSSTEYSSSRAYLRELSAYYANIYRLDHAKDYGYSVRCVKD